MPMRTTPRIAAFMPGASPPLVRTAMRFFAVMVDGEPIAERPIRLPSSGMRRPPPKSRARTPKKRAGPRGLERPDANANTDDGPEAQADADADAEGAPRPAEKNYITPAGHRRMTEEFDFLRGKKRPEVVGALADAAAEGDRSENAEYIYRKKQLREIDRRLRFLAKRLDIAVVVDPREQKRRDRVFFGAT